MTTLKIPIAEPIVALRLHGAAAAPRQDRATWLLSLREREERSRADSAALEQVAAALGAAAGALSPLVARRLDEVAALAVELGIAVAREIVGDALDRGHVDPTPTVVRCLRDCVRGSVDAELVVRLHPEDADLVQRRLRAMPELGEQLERARFVADPQVARGAVRAETDVGRLQYDPRDALERVAIEVRREVRA